MAEKALADMLELIKFRDNWTLINDIYNISYKLISY